MRNEAGLVYTDLIAFVPVHCWKNMTREGMKHRMAVVRDSPIFLNCAHVDN